MTSDFKQDVSVIFRSESVMSRESFWCSRSGSVAGRGETCEEFTFERFNVGRVKE